MSNDDATRAATPGGVGLTRRWTNRRGFNGCATQKVLRAGRRGQVTEERRARHRYYLTNTGEVDYPSILLAETMRSGDVLDIMRPDQPAAPARSKEIADTQRERMKEDYKELKKKEREKEKEKKDKRK